MANLNDISTVVASALTEVNLSGTLDVQMDGDEKIIAIGDKGDASVIRVLIETPAQAA